MGTHSLAAVVALTLISQGAAGWHGPPTGALPPAAASQTAGAAAHAPAALDQLLAPIALYPDALLSEMLLCATNPGMVGALGEWLQSNGGLAGSERQDAAHAAGFEPSFVALTVFPDVVGYMAREMAWTTKL